MGGQLLRLSLRHAISKEFGITHMAIAALGPWSPRTTETVDDVKRYVEPFNAFTEFPATRPVEFHYR